MTLDTDLKNEIAKVFWVQGYFAETEVKLLRPDYVPVSRKPRVELTDIDVLGISLRQDFTQRLVLADCKFGASIKEVRSSAISRTFWLCGVMKFYGADEGFAILRKNIIEPDHKHVSRRLGVTLLESSQVPALQIRVGVSDAIHSAPQFSAPWLDSRSELDKSWKSGEFLLFRDFRYWLLDASKSTKDLIGAAVEIAPRLPRKRPCASWFCDLTTLFSLSLARLAVELKHADLALSNKKEMEDALLSALYGGQDNYQFRVNVLSEFHRQLKLMNDNLGGRNPVPELSEKLIRLPAWDDLIELFARILNAYGAAIHIPRVARTLHSAFLVGREMSRETLAAICGLTDDQITRVLDLQGRVVAYLTKATKLGVDFVVSNGLEFLLKGEFIPSAQASSQHLPMEAERRIPTASAPSEESQQERQATSGTRATEADLFGSGESVSSGPKQPPV